MTDYELHPEARVDLDGIWDFIASRNLDAADALLAEIFSAIRSLSFSRHRGFRRSDLTSRPLRFIVLREYLIAYVPDETPVQVIAVVHGRRNPRAIAAILRGRE